MNSLKFAAAGLLLLAAFTAASAASHRKSGVPARAAKAAPEPARPSRAEARAEWPLDIPPADAKVYLETENPELIDVRTPDEYAAGHLENSRLIDYRNPNFREEMDKQDKTKKYLIYCRTGKRSGEALKVMKELGFQDIHDIAGGITAWTAAGLPVVK